MPVLLVVALGVGGLIVTSSLIQFNSDSRSAGIVLEKTAKNESERIVAVLNDALGVTRTNAVWASHLAGEKLLDRKAFANALLQQLVANSQLTGVYAGFEPDFDGRDAQFVGTDMGDERGRYLIYAYRNSGKTSVEVTPMTGDAAEEFWYHRPMREKTHAVTPPYWYEVGGEQTLMVTIVAPVVVADKSVGVVTADISLKTIQQEVSRIKPMSTGWAALLSADGQWVAGPVADQLGKPSEPGPFRDALSRIGDGSIVQQEIKDPVSGEKATMVMVPVRFGQAKDVWGFAVVVPNRAIFADAVVARNTLIGLGLAGLLVIAVLVVVVGNSIAAPVRAMTAAMSDLAGGNLQVTVVGGDRRDELGAMAKAVQVFKDNALEMQELNRRTQEMEREAEETRRRLMRQTAESFESEVAGVARSVGTAAGSLQNVANSMREVAARVSDRASLVAAAAGNATGNVQTVASAAEELSASISEISAQVSRSASVAKEAVSQVNTNRQNIGRLNETVQKIGEVVTLINDIASQTNLLALNATIEAARAGDAGKGFAVVAGEVKSLANQTSRATEEISGQVSAVQAATRMAVDAIGQVSATIEEISQIASQIAAAVEEQSAATQEISRSVQQAADSTRQVSDSIAEVDEGARSNGQAAGSVLNAAEMLAGDAADLTGKVEGFLAGIRSV
ncbi:MAG: methyl-accepting chemotaxis protein [Magnetospirillum sp.]|nr:methyl-accepting chemotaxis protein [Magnetospirillum sp.]